MPFEAKTKILVDNASHTRCTMASQKTHKKPAARKTVKARKPAKTKTTKLKTSGKVSYIPKGFQSIVPYLLVENGQKMLDFLKTAFHAKEDHVTRDDQGNFRHASLSVLGSMVMMGEVSGEWKAMPCSLYVYVKDCDGAHKAALAAGAKEIMPPMDMFYGDRHGGFYDPCGNQWWLATHFEDLSRTELERRAKEELRRRAQQQQA